MTSAPFQSQNGKSNRGRAGAAAGSKSRGGPAADKDGVDRSWRRSIGERILDSVGGFHVCRGFCEEEGLGLGYRQMRAWSTRASTNRKGRCPDVQEGKNRRQEASGCNKGIRLCPGVDRRLAGIASWAALAKNGRSAEGGESEAFKGKLRRQVPLLHDNRDAAAQSTRCVVRLPS